MGYACPVCDDLQGDIEHLADHLAFTAILGDDDHEAWLEANAPGWESGDASELADRIVDQVESVELPDGLESDGHAQDDHYPGVAFDDFQQSPTSTGAMNTPVQGPSPHLDQEARNALREAYEMTQQMRTESGEDNQDDKSRNADESDRTAGDAEESVDDAEAETE